jgi:hypothetical protein
MTAKISIHDSLFGLSKPVHVIAKKGSVIKKNHEPLYL